MIREKYVSLKVRLESLVGVFKEIFLFNISISVLWVNQRQCKHKPYWPSTLASIMWVMRVSSLYRMGRMYFIFKLSSLSFIMSLAHIGYSGEQIAGNNLDSCCMDDACPLPLPWVHHWWTASSHTWSFSKKNPKCWKNIFSSKKIGAGLVRDPKPFP